MEQQSLGRYESGLRNGPVLVAMHGVTDNAPSLSDLARHWQKSWRVVLMDTLGHGLSPRLSREQLSDPVGHAFHAAMEEIALLAKESLSGKVVLVGHSLGGAISAKIAVERPDLVAALVLDDPALLTSEQAAMYAAAAKELVERQNIVTNSMGEAISELAKVYPNWPKAEYGGWAQGKAQVDLNFVATGVVGIQGRGILKKLVVPTLVVTSDANDSLIGPEGIAQIETMENPKLTAVLIADATHTVRRDQAEAFYQAADEFLCRHVTRGIEKSSEKC